MIPELGDEKLHILYDGGYSLPWKHSLFSSDISKISYTDCHMQQRYKGFFCGILVIVFRIPY